MQHFILAFIWVVFGINSHNAQAFPPLLLNIGEQRSLPARGLKKFSLGQSQLVKATVLDLAGEKRILLKALSPGQTDLWIWNENARPTRVTIEVVKNSGSPGDPRLLRDLAQLQETEIYFAEKKIILRGEISQVAELTLIHALTESYPSLIENWTELSPALVADVTAKVTDYLRAHNLAARVHLSRVGSDWQITGALPAARDVAPLARDLRRILPTLKIELNAFTDNDPTVHFRAYLLEIKKSRMQQLGLKWPAQGASLFTVAGTQFKSALQLDVALNALETDGSLNVLSRPEVAVRAPGEAKLFSGGQVPITHQSKSKTNTEWKPFGLTFHLKVKDTAGDRVRLDIETEVSQPDPTWQNADQVPGFQINQMQTQVDAVFGKPLFLSGLIQQSVRESVQGLPFLKDLPVLGKLFGSKDYQTQKSELVAILLPDRAPPAAAVDGAQIQVRRAHLPRGWIPIPRNWVSADEETKLRLSPDFPFNALERASR